MDKDGITKKIEHDETVVPEIKLSRFRWWILVVYMTYSAASTFQWISYCIISNSVMKYYNVSASAVEWSSLIYLIQFPICVFPVSFIIEKLGLRVAAFFGALLTTLAAVVKLLSIGRDLYFVVLIAQTLGGISQTFILPLPLKIAATWFLPKEASRVCAMGLVASTFGTALGYLIPPIIVRDHEDINKIGSDLRVMNAGLAGICGVSTLMVFFYFPKEPKHAPSLAEFCHRENRKNTTIQIFWNTLKKLIKNRPFLLHLISYGSYCGSFIAFDTILNQLVLQYFPGAQEDAGRMGLLMLLGGMMGTLAIGIVLDKTRKFKESSIVIGLLCAVTIGAFLYCLEMRSKWMCYMSIALFGFLFGAFLPLGFEFAAELTYPLPESTVGGIFVAIVQLSSVGFTILLSHINRSFGAFYCLLTQVAIFVFGTIITCMTPNKLYRQEAFKKDMVFANVNFRSVQHVDV